MKTQFCSAEPKSETSTLDSASAAASSRYVIASGLSARKRQSGRCRASHDRTAATSDGSWAMVRLLEPPPSS